MARKFGDRRDGRKIREIDGLHNILIDLKPRRCDSDVYINQKIDVTNLIKFIEKKKKSNEDIKITYFHAFCMAFGKLFYNRPLLNRFICDRTTYEHNDVVIAFVAKIAFHDESEEMMINIPVEENDNIYDLSKKITAKVDKIRNSRKSEKQDNTNDVVNIVGKLPKILRVPLVGIFKFLDRKGMLPASFTKDNIYYSSLIVSNLGNLKIGSIYHNITNFGTSSFLATIGEIHKEVVVDEKGKEKVVDVCDFGINCDERIADGYYFATGIKLFEYILQNPELLEDKACEKVEIK